MMRVAYALVSSPSDYYLEQAYVSMFSLKHHMPDASIVLVTDDITRSSFEGTRKKELRWADEIISVPLDEFYTQQQRSRLVKASIRDYVTGDYLYIDCDTIICRPFPSLAMVTSEISACVDTHCPDFQDNPYRWLCLAHGQDLDWPIDRESVYFNSGVLYVTDSPVSHEFYRRWQVNLREGFSKGVLMDQPSFAKTNYQMGHVVHVLDDVWNCELKHGIRFLKDAYIVHYLTTNTSPDEGAQLFRLNEMDLLEEIKKTGDIPDEVVTIVEDPFKGLSPLTHVFAGGDVYFFQTPSYRAISKSGRDIKAGLSSSKDRQGFVFSELFFYMMKHYPHGVAGFLDRALHTVRTVKKKMKRH